VVSINQTVEGVSADEVKAEWKRLWRSRVDDKDRAEGVANELFPLIFVERGTVIVATRDFRPLNLKEILSAYKFKDVNRLVGQNPSVGGMAKFAKAVLNKQYRFRRLPRLIDRSTPAKVQQLKQGGRGWLHK